MPKISIIVPIYNAEDVLKRCIESILNQTYTDFELILINDGSKDNSIDIMRKYAQEDARIRVIDNKNNGVSETRNIGIREALGEYIQFIDSDDYIDDNMLENSLKLLEESYADIIITGIYLDLEHNGSVNSSVQTYGYKFADNNIEIAVNVLDRLGGTYINSPINKLYKRSIILENNIFMDKNIDLGEDLLFNLEYFKHCKAVIFDEKCYYHYCMRLEENLTAKYRENKLDLMKRLHDECREFLIISKVNENQLKELNNIFIKWIYSSFLDLHNKNCPYKSKEKLEYIRRYICEYKGIIDNTTSGGLTFSILRIALKSSRVTFIISKVLYIIKNNFRQIMYKR